MFKEAVKVDRHEENGHIKLYWTISLPDSCTLNGMVELKYTVGGKEIQHKYSL